MVIYWHHRQITLPSGWQAYGILLELINGPTAYELLDSQPLDLEDQKALVRHSSLMLVVGDPQR